VRASRGAALAAGTQKNNGGKKLVMILTDEDCSYSL
ncbi:mCG146218, partial [Mus musculus]